MLTHHLLNPVGWTVSSLCRDDGTNIRFATYRSGAAPIVQTLLFLNGRTEYIEKYEYFFLDLALPDGYLVVTMDHRGQGGSDGRRAHVDQYQEFGQDVAAVIAATAKDVPYHIVAHSMGGLISLWSSMKGLITPASMHLLSPLLGIYHPLASRSLLRLLAQVGCALGKNYSSVLGSGSDFGSFSKNVLTSNQSRYEQIIKSPFGFEPITYGWLKATLVAIEEVFQSEQMMQLSCPVQIATASGDRVVDSFQAQGWVAAARQLGINAIHNSYSGRHELLSEDSKIYNDIVLSIRSYIGLETTVDKEECARE